jgi:hypothetical protein
VTLFGRIVAALTAAHVPHAVIGAGALAVHGVARSTLDLDLFTLDTSVLDPGTWAELEREGVEIDARRGDADDPLAGVVRFARETERPVDLVVGRAAWMGRAIGRAAPATIERVTVPVVQARDLIRLKLFAGGIQDRWDIEQLLAGSDRQTLIADVAADLADLPDDARELWSAIVGSR